MTNRPTPHRLALPALTLVLAGLATACWTPAQDTVLDLSEVAFRNRYLSDTVDARMRIIDLGRSGWPALPTPMQDRLEALAATTGDSVDTLLLCPDGDSPRIYALKPNPSAGNAPLAVLLHQDALDYTLTFESRYTYFAQMTATAEGLVDADRDRPTKLSMAWADEFVHKFLGLPTDLPVAEGEEQGAMAAALLEAGYQVLIPTNCWGDQWSGDGRNLNHAEEAGDFARMGMFLAAATLEVARNVDGDYPLDIDYDPARLAIYAPSDAGRGLAEMALLGATDDIWPLPLNQAVLLLESSPDNLGPLLNSTDEYTALWVEGVAHTIGLPTADLLSAVAEHSLQSAIQSMPGTYVGQARLTWFDRGDPPDPNTPFPYPPASMTPLADAINTTLGPPSTAEESIDLRLPATNIARDDTNVFHSADAFVNWASIRIGWAVP